MKKLVKNIYGLVPFKKQIFGVLRQVWRPSVSVSQHLKFKGDFKTTLGDGRTFWMRNHGFKLENDLFWQGLNGKRERTSYELWIKMCQLPGVKTIFDLGANSGIYTMIAKTVNPSAKVVAVEAMERNLNLLKQNVALNGFTDVVPVCKAASDYDGTCTIFDPGSDHVYSVTVNHNLYPEKKSKEVEIPTTRMDTLSRELGIAKIDVMKIDVETHEPETFEGMGEYLRKHRPAMIVEILGDDIAAKCEEKLAGLDYLLFDINEKKGTITRVNTLRDPSYRNFLICTAETAQQLGLQI